MKIFIAFLIGISICNASNELSRNYGNIDCLVKKGDGRLLFGQNRFEDPKGRFFEELKTLLNDNEGIKHQKESDFLNDHLRLFEDIHQFYISTGPSPLKTLLNDNEGIKHQKESDFLSGDPCFFKNPPQIYISSDGKIFVESSKFEKMIRHTKPTLYIPTEIFTDKIIPYVGDIDTLFNLFHLRSDIRDKIKDNKDELLKSIFKIVLPLYSPEETLSMSLRDYFKIKKLHQKVINIYTLMLEKMGEFSSNDKKGIDTILNKLSKIYPEASLSGKTVKKMKELANKNYLGVYDM